MCEKCRGWSDDLDAADGVLLESVSDGTPELPQAILETLRLILRQFEQMNTSLRGINSSLYRITPRG